MLTENIINKLADLEARIADCEAQLEGHAHHPLKDGDWEARCRYALARLKAQRLAILRLTSRPLD